MKHHRNSQKRIYLQDAVYFVTGKTKNNYPFFKEEVFCDLFVENLRVCKRLKEFRLFAWVLCFDHFHLLLQPGDGWDYSDIIHNLKRITSLHINQWTPQLRVWRNEFAHQQKLLPPFRWQSSFYDHIIRNETDFNTHFEYIKFNPEKHGLPKNWSSIFTNPKYSDLIGYPE